MNALLGLGLWIGRLFGRMPRFAVAAARSTRTVMTARNATRVLDVVDKVPPDVVEKAMRALDRPSGDPHTPAVVLESYRAPSDADVRALAEARFKIGADGLISLEAPADVVDNAAGQADGEEALDDVLGAFDAHVEDDAALGAEAAAAF